MHLKKPFKIWYGKIGFSIGACCPGKTISDKEFGPILGMKNTGKNVG